MHIELYYPDGDYQGTAAILYGSLAPAITEEAERGRAERLAHLKNYLLEMGMGVLIGREVTAGQFQDFVSGEADDLANHTLTTLLWASDGGTDEGIIGSDGEIVRPRDIPDRVSTSLRIVLFSCCTTPRWAEAWYTGFANRLVAQSDNERVAPPTVLGWGGLASRGQMLGHYSPPESSDDEFKKIFEYLKNPVLMPTSVV